ncbi:MAG: DsbA family oxidoreductase [Pseudomonadota bacterium]|nr:DsbA family oxidoreductase [Pseudomonadota bacterium]
MTNAAEHQAQTTVTVDIWSDIMCPFCYMGDTLLRQAASAAGIGVDIRYHSYQLMPNLPGDLAVNVNDLLEQERGIPRAQAVAMNQQVAERAAQVGLAYDMDAALATNTKPAHRLTHFAKSHGKQEIVMEALFRAYLTEGRNIGDHEVLADIAQTAGLDRAATKDALASDAFAQEVEADIAQAHQIGIGGVPFFVLNGKYAVSGAQPHEVFQRALSQAAAMSPSESQAL